MNPIRLRYFTTARVALGRVGDSLPTQELLAFQLAHARARDAVHAQLDSASLALELTQKGWECVVVRSAARDRAEYLRRPDLGRRLAENVSLAPGNYDACVVIADGLSALAIERHAVPLLDAFLPALIQAGWKIAPLLIATQARVAVGDAIGVLLGAKMSVVLIGERPGLSSPDSLGVYLTWDPKPGRTDAERNCLSNIREEGLSYALAAHKLLYLMTEARRRRISGVTLKEEAAALLGPVSSKS
jgi:ethanolamine ammonia-lyase small subunit